MVVVVRLWLRLPLPLPLLLLLLLAGLPLVVMWLLWLMREGGVG